MITRRQAILIIVITLFIVFTGYFTIKYKHNRAINNKNKNLNDLRELIADIAEVIIPATNSPGAKEARVADYILNVLENCIEIKNFNIILNGLEDLKEYSLKTYSTSFEKCTLKNKIAVLEHFEKNKLFKNLLLSKIQRKIFGQSFFEQMKWLTVSGYCQSKIGATQALAYDHIPIDYVSCIPYFPNQKSWATK